MSNSFVCGIVGFTGLMLGVLVCPTQGYTSCAEVPIPSLTKEFVTPDDDANMVFLDVNGLSNVVESPFGVEFLGSEFGFLEGPRWIEDDSYNEGGYLLFTALNDGIIWKYFVNNDNIAELECFSVEFEGLGPNAIGWNKNYGNELWIVLFFGNAVLRYDINTMEELNRFTNDNMIAPNDIVVDSNGNAYFTTFPALYSDATLIGGTWKIIRDNDDQFEMSLIEQFTYGPNGIAMTLDESLIVATNGIDFPLGVFNLFDFNQVNYDNLYFRGYNLPGIDSSSSSSSSSSDDSDYLVGFNYYVCSSNPSFFDAGFLLDSSEFDNFDNLWQSQATLPGGPLGNGIIINPIVDSNNPIIGTITFGNGITPSNFAYDNINGYMYATVGDFVANIGNLVRIKLKDE